MKMIEYMYMRQMRNNKKFNWDKWYKVSNAVSLVLLFVLVVALVWYFSWYSTL